MAPITSLEIAALERLETIISKGQQTFVEVGMALTKIREQKLYRRDYDSFEAYCQCRWGWTRQRAHQLEQAASVVQALPEKVSTVVDSEWAARELAKVPEQKRVAVVKRAHKNGAEVTSASIAEAAKSLPSIANVPVKPPIELDDYGYALPALTVPLWHRRHELQDVMTEVSRIKCKLEKAREDDDPLYRGIRSTIYSELSGVHYQISRIKPVAVCTDCEGHTEAFPHCRLCHGTGLIGKEGAEQITAKEKMAIRQKVIESKKR